MQAASFFRSLDFRIALLAAGVASANQELIEIAKSAGKFNTLVIAMEASGLTDTLKGKFPVTVFSPTDEAFAKLPAGTVDALLKDKAKLNKILT